VIFSLSCNTTDRNEICTLCGHFIIKSVIKAVILIVVLNSYLSLFHHTVPSETRFMNYIMERALARSHYNVQHASSFTFVPCSWDIRKLRPDGNEIGNIRLC